MNGAYLFRHKFNNKLNRQKEYYQFKHPIHPYKERLQHIRPLLRQEMAYY